MTESSRAARRSRTLLGLLLLALFAVVAAFVAPGMAAAVDGHGRPVPPPPAQPTSADQIQNIDQVKTAIKAYYGDTVTNQVDPVTDDGKDVLLHTFDPNGAYAREMAGVADTAGKYLQQRATSHHFSGTPAIVLDVDDTTLNTYNYEIYSNFVYNPTQNAVFVNGAYFPAVPSMPALVNAAKARGFTIFFLTGRPEGQRPGTTTNLANAGYPAVPAEQIYLKDQTKPWLASCAPTCNTIQYKSLTRQHIESLGFDIVANFGDQFSDLKGGFEDKAFKLPNPMYYLP